VTGIPALALSITDRSVYWGRNVRISVKGDCDEELKELLTDIDESDSLFLIELRNELTPINASSRYISTTFDGK